MDSGSGAGPLLPVIRTDLIDEAELRFTRVFEIDEPVALGLGVDINYPEINSPLSAAACQPDVRLTTHVLISGCWRGYYGGGRVSLALRNSEASGFNPPPTHAVRRG